MANLAVRPNWRGTGNNDSAVSFYQVNLGKKTHAGKILGGGTSSDAVLSSTASEKMASFYSENSAASGTSVALYWKHTVTGIAGSGVTARFYQYANVAAALLVGAQITAETGAAGKVSGLMTGCRSQVSFADDATQVPTGTIAGGQSELYFNGDNSSTTNVQTSSRCSLHRFIVDGDTTARAKANIAFEFVNIAEGTSDNTVMLNTANITASHGLRCVINDAVYMMLLDKV